MTLQRTLQKGLRGLPINHRPHFEDPVLVHPSYYFLFAFAYLLIPLISLCVYSDAFLIFTNVLLISQLWYARAQVCVKIISFKKQKSTQTRLNQERSVVRTQGESHKTPSRGCTRSHHVSFHTWGSALGPTLHSANSGPL